MKNKGELGRTEENWGDGGFERKVDNLFLFLYKNIQMLAYVKKKQ